LKTDLGEGAPFRELARGTGLERRLADAANNSYRTERTPAMFRKMISAAVATVFALGLLATAAAAPITGRTTNGTYKTATQAALHTGAFYMSQAAHKAYEAKDLKVIKEGRTPTGKISSTWRLQTIAKTPFGYPIANVTVKVKKLGDHAWKGYTAGKNGVSFLK
jgi:hypothetical protein